MTLSILIVNWNSRDYLRRCLTSIREHCSELEPQIVVVDGGSFDGCAEMLAAEFPEVEFVQSECNLGFGRSNNLGFQRVTGKALLLLNPDTEVRAGAVQAMLRALQALPNAGIVGARLLNADGSLQLSSVHRLPNPLNVAFDMNWLRLRWWRKFGHATVPFRVEAVSGACMMMLTTTFGRFAGFDPRYFMYAEDMDLCFQVSEAGMCIYHEPAARVVHHGGASSGKTFGKFSAVMISEALRTYLVANQGRSHGLACQGLLGLSAILRLPLLSASWAVSRGATRERRRASIRRWTAVLRWSLGREGWARENFRTGPAAVDPPPAAAAVPGG